MSKYNIESFYRTVFPQGVDLSSLGDTPVSRTPKRSSGFVTLEPNTAREEMVYYSSKDDVNKTIYIERRGISPTASGLDVAGVDYANPLYQFAHPSQCVGSGDINNLHINQFPDFDGVATVNSIIANDLTALETITIPNYANASARDSAITSPQNGMEVYLVSEGYITDYVGGTWVTRASGAVANASTTISGKLEVATALEIASGATTGGSGAELAVVASSCKKTSSGVADENNLPVIGADGTVNQFINNLPGSKIILSDSGVTGGKYYGAIVTVNSKGIVTAIEDGIDIVSGTTYSGGNISTSRSFSNTSYEKKKELLINSNGTYRIAFTLSASSGDEAYGRIYKNGVPFGTERYISSTLNVEFVESLSFNKGDLLQIYTKKGGSTSSAVLSNSSVSFNISFSKFGGVVILD